MGELQKLQGIIVDLEGRTMFRGTVYFDTHIRDIIPEQNHVDQFILPGLVDAHVHVESSMLPPSSFARLAVRHGVVAAVSDPHEIANVAGLEGIRFMLRSASDTPFRFLFGAPSCVPATGFETSGASISPEEVRLLLERGEAGYLSEVMNVPGVLYGDPSVAEKLRVALHLGVPVDGHAPGLSGASLEQYVAAGITTDHECVSLQEAREKAALGMQILIREGSAAKNFEALLPLLGEVPGQVMFCSDDLHPDDLLKGHINRLVARAIQKGYDVYDVLRAASLNPLRHYRMEQGLLRVGDRADIICVDNLQQMSVMTTFIGGVLCWDGPSACGLPEVTPEKYPNRFDACPVSRSDIQVLRKGSRIRVIGVTDGSLITRSLEAEIPQVGTEVGSMPDRDIVKVVVMNRYQKAAPQVAFVSGTGIKSGAMGGTVAHDSHNIVAFGAEDALLVKVVNALVHSGGGIAAAHGEELKLLPLPIAGLMSVLPGEKTATLYSELNDFARQTGCTLQAPFMTLSFLSLLVIPELKLSDQGLFDAKDFAFTSLFP